MSQLLVFSYACNIISLVLQVNTNTFLYEKNVSYMMYMSMHVEIAPINILKGGLWKCLKGVRMSFKIAPLNKYTCTKFI